MFQVYFMAQKKMHHELNHDAKLVIALYTKKDKSFVSDVCRKHSEFVGRILSEEFYRKNLALCQLLEVILCLFLHVNTLLAWFAILCRNIATGNKFQHATLVLNLLKE